MNIHELILGAQSLLGRSIQGASSDEEKKRFEVAATALMFISETGAVHAFEDYLQFRRQSPPHAVAFFERREEADAWLRQHPEPPHGAFVLVADAYHIVMHVREVGHRQLFPHPTLDGFLEQLLQEDPPPNELPSFETRDEAIAWLKGRSEPQKIYMRMSGRTWVALHHRKLNHYSLHLLPSPSTAAQGEKQGLD